MVGTLGPPMAPRQTPSTLECPPVVDKHVHGVVAGEHAVVERTGAGHVRSPIRVLESCGSCSKSNPRSHLGSKLAACRPATQHPAQDSPMLHWYSSSLTSRVGVGCLRISSRGRSEGSLCRASRSVEALVVDGPSRRTANATRSWCSSRKPCPGLTSNGSSMIWYARCWPGRPRDQRRNATRNLRNGRASWSADISRPSSATCKDHGR